MFVTVDRLVYAVFFVVFGTYKKRALYKKVYLFAYYGLSFLYWLLRAAKKELRFVKYFKTVRLVRLALFLAFILNGRPLVTAVTLLVVVLRRVVGTKFVSNAEELKRLRRHRHQYKKLTKMFKKKTF